MERKGQRGPVVRKQWVACDGYGVRRVCVVVVRLLEDQDSFLDLNSKSIGRGSPKQAIQLRLDVAGGEKKRKGWAACACTIRLIHKVPRSQG